VKPPNSSDDPENIAKIENAEKTGSTWIDCAKVGLATAVLLGFGWILFYMFGETKTAETEWTRAVNLFQGVEAVAFAAAGFIFGKDVHRARAENAEKRADANEKEASKGKALAEVVKAKAHAHPAKAATFAAMATSTQHAFDVNRAELDELANVAREMFP
jgi:chemotaxis protein histidine kinase CheA